MADTEVTISDITISKIKDMRDAAVAGEARCMEKLNRCGPRGNTAIERDIDLWRGRRNALTDVLDLLSI